jgi:hypothetical protein
MAVLFLAYFSYGISVFSLKNCAITILEILRYTVFAILDSKTAVNDKICLRYYSIEYPPMPPSLRLFGSFSSPSSVNKFEIDHHLYLCTASYPGAMCCSMACAAFAWAAWINFIDSISSHACRPACVSRDGVAQQSPWVRG